MCFSWLHANYLLEDNLLCLNNIRELVMALKHILSSLLFPHFMAANAKLSHILRIDSTLWGTNNLIKEVQLPANNSISGQDEH